MIKTITKMIKIENENKSIIKKSRIANMITTKKKLIMKIKNETKKKKLRRVLLQARKNEPERGFLCKKAETRGASRLR